MHTNSNITFIEYKDALGSTVAYALYNLPNGRQVVIGRIEKGYDNNAKMDTYTAFDSSGKQISPPRYRIKYIKEYYLRDEQSFAKQVFQQEKSVAQSGVTFDAFANELSAANGKAQISPIQRIRKSKQKSKIKSRTR